MIGENGVPETPDWHPEPHACPFDNCQVCETRQQSIAFHVPDSIERGDN